MISILLPLDRSLLCLETKGSNNTSDGQHGRGGIQGVTGTLGVSVLSGAGAEPEGEETVPAALEMANAGE